MTGRRRTVARERPVRAGGEETGLRRTDTVGFRELWSIRIPGMVLENFGEINSDSIVSHKSTEVQ